MKKILFSQLRYFNAQFNKNQTPENSGTYKKVKKQLPQQEFIYGVNSVEAAIHAGKRILYQMYISDSQAIELNSKTIKLINYAKQNQLKLTYSPKLKLDRLASKAPHQNVVLRCSSLPFGAIKKDENPLFENGVYVYTDRITDPQNFGSIIRSCLFYGVKHVFSSKKNHCPLNPTVSKASSGAVELMSISLIEKSEQFLLNWKSQGGFILSTEVSEINKKIYPVQELQKLQEQDKLEKILVILGSEGFGVSDHLRKYSDYKMLIQRKGETKYPYSLIDSLNVNAALSAILFELTKNFNQSK